MKQQGLNNKYCFTYLVCFFFLVKNLLPMYEIIYFLRSNTALNKNRYILCNWSLLVRFQLGTNKIPIKFKDCNI